MAEVENMRATGKSVDDASGFVDQVLPATNHMIRRKISLNTSVDLHILRPPIRVNRGIQGHAINAGCTPKANIFLPGLARESNDRNVGIGGFQGRNDALYGGNREVVEILSTQRSGPTVEKLDDLGPGFDLLT